VTPLRQRMLHELQRRNYSPSTIRSYLGAVQQFAEHFHCSPEQLGPEHLRRYQVFLLQEKKLEPSTVEIRISALRFLYKRTLRRREFTYDDLIFPKVPQKLAIVLSQEEVLRLIDAAPNRLYRMILVLHFRVLCCYSFNVIRQLNTALSPTHEANVAQVFALISLKRLDFRLVVGSYHLVPVQPKLPAIGHSVAHLDVHDACTIPVPAPDQGKITCNGLLQIESYFGRRPCNCAERVRC
jgi:hypothetical protein